MKLRVAIVDDHRVVRGGLASFLESFPDLEVAGLAGSGEEALDKVPGWAPDVVVMDLRLAGGLDGLETTRRLLAASPGLRVVVLTAHPDEGPLVAALRAGALGYVRKDADPQTFLAAVRSAAEGKVFLDPAVAGPALRQLARGGTAVESLSGREQAVLKQLARGGTNRQIAAALGVSEETVKTHVASIFGKLQLSHRAQAVVYALKSGLVTLDEIELP
jgi:NarL family two-component system response regulator LiaR